jgi:hypothetical protein
MTSRLQQPCHAGEQAPRRFVAFMFRLHAHPQPDRAGDMRRLDRKVMCEREERGIPLDKLEKFLGALGIVGVEVGGNHVTISADKYQALLVLAREALGTREEF